jgi:probable HAF family extracellular repeat protein
MDVVEGTNPTVSIVLIPLVGELPISVTVGSIIVTVEPVSVTLSLQEKLQLTATIRDSEGNVIPEQPIWGSVDPDVAVVNDDGLVLAVANGTAQIVAVYGNVVGVSTIEVASGVVGDIVLIGPPNFTEGVAMDLNNQGQVAGWTSIFGRRAAFVWSEEAGITSLGSLGGGRSEAYAINESGHVVGHSTNDSNQRRAFLWTPDSGMVELGTLGGYDSAAYGINDAGVVVGESWTVDDGWHAFMWTAGGGMVDLGSMSNSLDQASSINESAAIVGMLDGVAFFRTPLGAIIDIGTLGGESSAAWAINELGQVAGDAPLASGVGRGFVWTQSSGSPVILDHPGGVESSVRDINDLGQVAGWITTENEQNRAIVWLADGTPVDIGLALDNTTAFAINNHGWVVGQGDIAGATNKAVLWKLNLQ